MCFYTDVNNRLTFQMNSFFFFFVHNVSRCHKYYVLRILKCQLIISLINITIFVSFFLNIFFLCTRECQRFINRFKSLLFVCFFHYCQNANNMVRNKLLLCAFNDIDNFIFIYATEPQHTNVF